VSWFAGDYPPNRPWLVRRALHLNTNTRSRLEDNPNGSNADGRAWQFRGHNTQLLTRCKAVGSVWAWRGWLESWFPACRDSSGLTREHRPAARRGIVHPEDRRASRPGSPPPKIGTENEETNQESQESAELSIVSPELPGIRRLLHGLISRPAHGASVGCVDI